MSASFPCTPCVLESQSTDFFHLTVHLPPHPSASTLYCISAELFSCVPKCSFTPLMFFSWVVSSCTATHLSLLMLSMVALSWCPAVLIANTLMLCSLDLIFLWENHLLGPSPVPLGRSHFLFLVSVPFISLRCLRAFDFYLIAKTL